MPPELARKKIGAGSAPRLQYNICFAPNPLFHGRKVDFLRGAHPTRSSNALDINDAIRFEEPHSCRYRRLRW